jgi:flagellar motility protein MotE (MotC chaperone)
LGRFMLGVLTMLLVLAGAVGVLFGLEKAGMIGLKSMTISVLGKIPGWGDLPEDLETGKRQREGWQEKEKTYQAHVAILKKENLSLKKELEKLQRAAVESPKKNVEPTGKPVAVMAKDKNSVSRLPESLGTTKRAARLLGEMKPQPAAEILMKIQPEVALEILDKVETRKAAKIIEAMPVDSGSALVARLAKKR